MNGLRSTLTDSFQRLPTSTPELDTAELSWWSEFADIEEKFCWVQPGDIHEFLRGHYVKLISSLVPPGSRIAELGCGTGWLSIMLAKVVSGEVVGIDFSPEQIQKAKRNASSAGLQDRARFEVGTVSDVSKRLGKLDAIIVHGFLHHLSEIEIRGVFATARAALVPQGHMIILEPVMYPRSPTAVRSAKWGARLRWIENVLLRGQRWGLRNISAGEAEVRRCLAMRHVGTFPRGPSPKEIPFAPGELKSLASDLFSVSPPIRCLAGSQNVARELLLLKLSHPYRYAILLWPMLWLSRIVEKQLLSIDPPPGDMWIFELFDCVPGGSAGT